jgi:diguanylate cyclase
MQYCDSIEDSRQYLRLTLEHIGKHGLPTDPINYCIWYEYASGKNEALNTAIDQHIENHGVFSEAICRAFFTQFISGGNQAITSRVTEELKKVFSEIIGAIKATNRHFSESGNNIDSINEALVPGLSEADVDKLANQIKNEIKKLESSNSDFKTRLHQATEEIDRLKAKMARYRNEALRDPLTRIDNRRGFEKKLIDAIATADSNATTLCIIMADIDHFKQVNDNHGHLVGDNLLRMVAATIKDLTKGKDTVARIGGEEFVIMLPDTPVAGATKLAEDMRRTFENLDLKKKNTGESLGTITLSFGITDYRQNDTAEAFLKRADKALYQSKDMGRNRVTCL